MLGLASANSIMMHAPRVITGLVFVVSLSACSDGDDTSSSNGGGGSSPASTTHATNGTGSGSVTSSTSASVSSSTGASSGSGAALLYDDGTYAVLVVTPEAMACGSLAQGTKAYYSCDSAWVAEVTRLDSASVVVGAQIALGQSQNPFRDPNGYFASPPCTTPDAPKSGTSLQIGGSPGAETATLVGFYPAVPSGTIPMTRCPGAIQCGNESIDQCITAQDCCGGTCYAAGHCGH